MDSTEVEGDSGQDSASAHSSDHIALIYETNEERLFAISTLIKVGLEKGELCIYISEEKDFQDLVSTLRQSKVDVDSAVKSGALILSNKRDIFFRLGQFDPEWTLRVLKNVADLAKPYGFSAIRVVSETFLPESVEGIDRWSEYESRLNTFLPGVDVKIICQYDKSRLKPEAIVDAIKTHPKLVFGGQICRNHFFVPPEEFLKPNYGLNELNKILESIRVRESEESEINESQQQLELIKVRLNQELLLGKKSEAALKQLDEDLKLLSHNSRDVIFRIRTHPNLEVEFATSAILSVTGYTAEEHYADHELLPKRIHPDDRQIFESMIGSSAPLKQPIIIRFIRTDGRIVPTEWKYSVALEAGKVVGIEGSCREIIENKVENAPGEDASEPLAEAEKARKEAEDRFRIAFGQNIVGIANLNKEGLWEEVNQRFCEIVGYSREELAGKSYLDITHPEDKEISERNSQPLLGGGQNSSFVKRYIRKDGSVAWVKVIPNPLYAEGAEIRGFINIYEDITDQRRASAALSESEDRFLAVFEQAGVGVARLDLNGRWVEANRRLCDILGYSSEEMAKMNYRDITHPHDISRSDERFRSLVEGKVTSSSMQKRYIRKDGKTVWTNIWVSVVGEGSSRYVIKVIEDITEQKRAEEALRENEERFRRIVETATEGIWMMDAAGKTTFVNQRMAEMLGYSVPEMVGRPALDFFEDPASSEVRDLLSKGPNTTFTQHDFKLHTRENKDLWAILSVSRVLDKDGRYAGILAMLTDITARKEVELALATEKESLMVTLRSIGDGVITTDTCGKIVLMNNAAESLTGWTQIDGVGKSVEEVFPVPEGGGEDAASPMWSVLKTGTSIHRPGRVRRVSKDHNFKTVEESGAPILDSSGRVLGAVLVFRDVTDKVRIEDELARTATLEAIGTLAGGIAHDFNNILTTILGNIAIANGYVIPEGRLYNKLREIEAASLRAKDLTQQLLTFSKGGEPIKRSASLSGLLTDTTRFALSGSNVKCIFAIDERLWPTEIDKGQISQVISNIIINAKEAMLKGGVIEVSAENSLVETGEVLPLSPGPYVKISIKDQGIGIPKENLTRIFEPYFTTKPSGTGLGLAISYSIIKKHGGALTVESEVGSGTTFHIYLPASSEELLPEMKGTMEAKAGKGKVLLMDDEEVILEVCGEILTHLGYSVEFSRDGTEMLEKYKRAMDSSSPFDVVVMDLTIPGGMGGEQAIKKLREMDPGVKAIVSSGYSNDPVMANYHDYGFVGVVPKPYNIAELSNAVHEAING